MGLRLRSCRAEQDFATAKLTFVWCWQHQYFRTLIVLTLLQKEEEDARKLYDEFVESFGDEPEQKASNRSFTRGGVIQPGSSASSVGTFSLRYLSAHL